MKKTTPDFTGLITNLNQEGVMFERMLGSKQNRDAAALFFKSYPDVIQYMTAHLLHNFITLNVFTREQYECYLKGVTDLGSLFRACKDELDQAIQTQTPNITPSA